MSSLIAVPELITTAATDLSNIGSTLSAATAPAAPPTTGVLAAAEDEVSAAIAAVFSAHGQGFQALGAQAAAFHDQFVQALTVGARGYADVEAIKASHLGQLLSATNAGANRLLAGPAATTAVGVALIIGGSGEPIPTPD